MVVYLLFFTALFATRTVSFNVVASYGAVVGRSCRSFYPLFMNENGDSIFGGSTNDDDGNDDVDDMPIIAQSTVKIDDGGSDLTDRFKYKVNALMGKYDPVQSETDNETTDGNILQAMMKFPTPYIFNIVGRTNGDDEVTKTYISDVNEIVLATSGDKELQYDTVPRGKNFVKIRIEAVVESASMINLIYKQLAEHELTVMRF